MIGWSSDLHQFPICFIFHFVRTELGSHKSIEHGFSVTLWLLKAESVYYSHCIGRPRSLAFIQPAIPHPYALDIRLVCVLLLLPLTVSFVFALLFSLKTELLLVGDLQWSSLPFLPMWCLISWYLHHQVGISTVKIMSGTQTNVQTTLKSSFTSRKSLSFSNPQYSHLNNGYTTLASCGC